MSEQEEPIVVTICDPDGGERDYAQDLVISHHGKNFAVLVSIPESEEDTEEPDIILARIDIDEEGDSIYVPPEDDEYDAVVALYDAM